MTGNNQSDIIKELIYVVIAGVAIALSNLLIRKLLPNTADEIIEILSYLLLALVIFSLLRGRRFLVPFAFTVLAVIIAASLFRFLFTEERTLYFVIDASSNMKDRFEEIRSRIELQAMSMPEEIDYGLAVFGGQLTSEVACNDITQLVVPSPKDAALPEISRAISLLANLEPRGGGALQEAILFAIDQMEGRRGIQQILVITSDLDETCEPLSRDIIETAVDENRIRIELIVVSVGNIDEDDRLAFASYADRFIPLEDAAELAPVIEDVVGTLPLPYGPYGEDTSR